MNQYKIVFTYSDGYEDEVIVSAVNRIMAFDVFKDLGYEDDIVITDCYLISDN
jgi:hypothetical protein